MADNQKPLEQVTTKATMSQPGDTSLSHIGASMAAEEALNAARFLAGGSQTGFSFDKPRGMSPVEAAYVTMQDPQYQRNFGDFTKTIGSLAGNTADQVVRNMNLNGGRPTNFSSMAATDAGAALMQLAWRNRGVQSVMGGNPADLFNGMLGSRVMMASGGMGGILNAYAPGATPAMNAHQAAFSNSIAQQMYTTPAGQGNIVPNMAFTRGFQTHEIAQLTDYMAQRNFGNMRQFNPMDPTDQNVIRNKTMATGGMLRVMGAMRDLMGGGTMHETIDQFEQLNAHMGGRMDIGRTEGSLMRMQAMSKLLNTSGANLVRTSVDVGNEMRGASLSRFGRMTAESRDRDVNTQIAVDAIHMANSTGMDPLEARNRTVSLNLAQRDSQMHDSLVGMEYGRVSGMLSGTQYKRAKGAIMYGTPEEQREAMTQVATSFGGIQAFNRMVGNPQVQAQMQNRLAATNPNAFSDIQVMLTNRSAQMYRQAGTDALVTAASQQVFGAAGRLGMTEILSNKEMFAARADAYQTQLATMNQPELAARFKQARATGGDEYATQQYVNQSSAFRAVRGSLSAAGQTAVLKAQAARVEGVNTPAQQEAMVGLDLIETKVRAGPQTAESSKVLDTLYSLRQRAGKGDTSIAPEVAALGEKYGLTKDIKENARDRADTERQTSKNLKASVAALDIHTSETTARSLRENARASAEAYGAARTPEELAAVGVRLQTAANALHESKLATGVDQTAAANLTGILGNKDIAAGQSDALAFSKHATPGIDVRGMDAMRAALIRASTEYGAGISPEQAKTIRENGKAELGATIEAVKQHGVVSAATLEKVEKVYKGLDSKGGLAAAAELERSLDPSRTGLSDGVAGGPTGETAAVNKQALNARGQTVTGTAATMAHFGDSHIDAERNTFQKLSDAMVGIYYLPRRSSKAKTAGSGAKDALKSGDDVAKGTPAGGGGSIPRFHGEFTLRDASGKLAGTLSGNAG